MFLQHFTCKFSVLFCFASAPARFPCANKKKESGKVLVVELFYYSNESVLIIAGCDVMFFFSAENAERKELYSFLFVH